MKPQTQQPELAQSKQVNATRLASLDAMRGITVALMLLVNNVALDTLTPKQFQHAEIGAGITLADMVFPWFLFCAGVSIPFSVASARSKGRMDWRHDARVLFRAVALVLLGVLVQSAIENQFSPALGVLGLIGLSSLVGAVFYDLAPFHRVLTASVMLAGYAWTLLYLPHDGGIIGVAGSQNLIKHLNDQILGHYYLSGLPSVVPAGALVMIGTLVGDLLLPTHRTHRDRLVILGLVAVGLTVLGFYWSDVLPLSKSIWTSSYICVAAGFGTALLGILYLVFDVAGLKRWATPFVVFGSNAIVAYVVPILVKVLVLQRVHIGQLTIIDWILGGLKRSLGDAAGGWVYTVGYVVVWWFVLLLLYRKKWFLRV